MKLTELVTIDLLTQDPNNDEFVLYLVEDGPWPTDDGELASVLKSIQDRILSAADAAIDGHVAQQYAESDGKKIRIQVDSPHGCPAQLRELVDAIAVFLSEDSSYSDAIQSSPHVAALRVVAGHSMGRFAHDRPIRC